MGWLSDLFRGPEPAPAPQAAQAPPAAAQQQDSPEQLERSRTDLVREINSSAGLLPTEGVVLARHITDVMGEVITLGRDKRLNVHARVTLDAMLTDYLPTTLRTFAAASRGGHDGVAQLRQQLDALHDAASDLLAAVRQEDVRSLEAQGVFLRSKYSGSELDL